MSTATNIPYAERVALALYHSGLLPDTKNVTIRELTATLERVASVVAEVPLEDAPQKDNL